MKCYYPQSDSKNTFPCGKCLPCRINKRNAWAGRLILEAQNYRNPLFVTLTYHDAYMHYTENGDMTLDPRALDPKDRDDLKLHIMRLRKRLGVSFRYFAVGEYGDLRGRPHYHYIIFTDLDPNYVGQEIRKCWKSSNSKIGYYDTSHKIMLRGKVTVDLFNHNRAKYVAQYTTKKLTSEKSLPDGAVKEFSRMSRKPGIAHDAIVLMAYRLIRSLKRCVYSFHGKENIMKMRTLRDFSQGCYRIDGKLYPMDRYIKEKLLQLIVASDLEKEKKLLMREMLSDLSSKNRYDINQDAKARHLAKVRTEKWRKAYMMKKRLIPTDDQL